MRLTMVHKYFIFWRPLPFTLKAALYLEAPGSNCPEDRPDNSKTRFRLTFSWTFHLQIKFVCFVYGIVLHDNLYCT